MANCPKCNKIWLWDEFCNNFTDPNGNECIQIELEAKHNNNIIEFVNLLCNCREILGTISRIRSLVGYSSWQETFIPIEWKDINFLMDHKHLYRSYMNKVENNMNLTYEDYLKLLKEDQENNKTK